MNPKLFKRILFEIILEHAISILSKSIKIFFIYNII